MPTRVSVIDAFSFRHRSCFQLLLPAVDAVFFIIPLVDCRWLRLCGRNVFRTQFLRLLTFSIPSALLSQFSLFFFLAPGVQLSAGFLVLWYVRYLIHFTLHRLILPRRDTTGCQHEVRELGRASLSRWLQGAHPGVQDAVLRDEGSRFARCFDHVEQKSNNRIPESPYLHTPSLLNPSAYYPGQSTVPQLPVLTTFIPSLPHNTPFRVSVHSWEKPRPSRMMESLMQPDDSVLYEVRIFIDGLCVS